MFDEIEEDEREIRRLQRGELFRRPKPKLPEQQGDVMERREQEPRFDWTYEVYNGKHGIFEGNLLVAVVGECFSRPEAAPFVCRQIVNDHNQHARLVEQQDRLVEALHRLSKTGCGALPLDEYRDWVKEVADNALASIEQEA